MNCKICKIGNVSQIVEATDIITKENFEYRKCSNCDVLYLAEIPADLGKYYFTNYYSFSPDNTSLLSRVKNLRDKFEVSGKGNIGKIFSLITPNYTLRSLKHLPLKKESRLLDSGCGTGRDIAVLREQGYTNVQGADPFIDKDVYHSNKVLVEKKNLSEVEGKFDFITMHHSFEHVPNPQETVEQAYKLLDKGGRLIIRIPVSDCWALKHYGKEWVQFDPPRHLFLHTQKSMKIIAEQAGFTMENIVYDSCDFQFWASEVTKSGSSVHTLPKNKVAYWKIMSLLRGYSRKAKQLNKDQAGDQAMFILKKEH